MFFISGAKVFAQLDLSGADGVWRFYPSKVEDISKFKPTKNYLLYSFRYKSPFILSAFRFPKTSKGWFTRKFWVDKNTFTASDLRLFIQEVHGKCAVYINKKLIGKSQNPGHVKIVFPKNIIKENDFNTISIFLTPDSKTLYTPPLYSPIYIEDYDITFKNTIISISSEQPKRNKVNLKIKVGSAKAIEDVSVLTKIYNKYGLVKSFTWSGNFPENDYIKLRYSFTNSASGFYQIKTVLVKKQLRKEINRFLWLNYENEFRKTKFLLTGWQFRPITKKELDRILNNPKILEKFPAKEFRKYSIPNYTTPDNLIPKIKTDKNIIGVILKKKISFPDNKLSTQNFIHRLRFNGLRGCVGMFFDAIPITLPDKYYIDPYIPFEVDLPNHLSKTTHTIYIVCVIPGKYYTTKDNHTPLPFYGKEMYPWIWDTVELRRYPRVHIEKAIPIIEPNQNLVNFNITVRNTTNSTYKTIFVEGTFYCSAQKHFKTKQITIAPRSIFTYKVKISGEKFPLWWPYEPKLIKYTFILKNSNGTLIDTFSDRFGYYKVQVNGKDILLNGRKLRLRRSSIANNRPFTPRTIWKIFSGIDQRKPIPSSTNSIRFHHGLPSKWMVDLADRLGIILTIESSCYGSSYNVENPDFWKYLYKQNASAVELFANNPSALFYSIENELWSNKKFMWGKSEQTIINKLCAIEQKLKKINPNRVYMFEGDGDLKGHAYITNLHYDPWISQISDWPNGAMRNIFKNWKGNKPYIAGEYGWDWTANPPAGLTSFLGDKVYQANQWEIAWFCTAKILTDNYRLAGLCGYNPWDVPFPDKVYQAVALIPVGFHQNFLPGQNVKLKYKLINERIYPVNAKMSWITKPLTIADNKTYKLNPGQIKNISIEFKVPESCKQKQLSCYIKLYENNHLIDIIRRKILIINPKIEKLPNLKIGIYKGHTVITKLFLSAGYRPKLINKISTKTLSDLNVLIIPPDSIDDEIYCNSSIIEYLVSNGLNVISFNQNEDFSWVPSSPLAEPKQYATCVYNTDYRGVFKTIENDTLRWWHDDHYVAKRCLFINSLIGPWQNIFIAGGKPGLKWSALSILNYGKGRYILSQLDLISKISSEPLAKIIFFKLIKLASLSKPNNKIVIDTQAHLPIEQLKRLLNTQNFSYTIPKAPNHLPHNSILISNKYHPEYPCWQWIVSADDKQFKPKQQKHDQLWIDRTSKYLSLISGLTDADFFTGGKLQYFYKPKTYGKTLYTKIYLKGIPLTTPPALVIYKDKTLLDGTTIISNLDAQTNSQFTRLFTNILLNLNAKVVPFSANWNWLWTYPIKPQNYKTKKEIQNIKFYVGKFPKTILIPGNTQYLVILSKVPLPDIFLKRGKLLKIGTRKTTSDFLIQYAIEKPHKDKPSLLKINPAEICGILAGKVKRRIFLKPISQLRPQAGSSISWTIPKDFQPRKCKLIFRLRTGEFKGPWDRLNDYTIMVNNKTQLHLKKTHIEPVILADGGEWKDYKGYAQTKETILIKPGDKITIKANVPWMHCDLLIVEFPYK